MLIVKRWVSTQQHEQDDAAGPHICYMGVLDAWALLQQHSKTGSQHSVQAGSRLQHLEWRTRRLQDD